MLSRGSILRRRASFTLPVVTTLLVCYLAAAPVASQPLPDGYWDVAKSRPILDKTLTIRLAPDLSSLPENERAAVSRLLEVGQILQRLYEGSRHHQAERALDDLVRLDRKLGSPEATQNLLALYRIFQGPIATTLDNKREPFLPVDPIVPGKNVYPLGITKQAIEKYLESNPEKRKDLLQVRTVVRVGNAANRRSDLATLKRHPALELLHPGLRDVLSSLPRQEPYALYAVPYSVAYADELLRVYGLLNEAAALLDASDPAFAQFLRVRSRDLLTNDYEGGDAVWVSSRFSNLNAELGSYEVYDDELYASKSFFAVSLLLRDMEQSEALRGAISNIQKIEDSLPYKSEKRVREDIPVGVYHVIADFGQARGTNTASILPNETQITAKYGRTILMRYNILTNPELFGGQLEAWNATVDASAAGDLHPDGDFYRTLWHEIGHYLGPDRSLDGRTVDDALEENSSTFEEMKADLVSLFASKALRESGYYDAARLRHVQAAGIRRVLRNNKPRREQPYATMQLIQFNFFLENGLLEYERPTQRLRIHYDRYQDVVTKLLREILELQLRGDKAAGDAFIDRYTTWSDDLHEVLAASMRAAQKYQYRRVLYAALGD